MNFAIKKAVVPAAVTAFIAAIILGTPELFTLVILTAAGFTFAVIVVAVFWRLSPISTWPLWKQRLGVWLIAAGAAAAGCCILLAPVIMRALRQ